MLVYGKSFLKYKCSSEIVAVLENYFQEVADQEKYLLIRSSYQKKVAAPDNSVFSTKRQLLQVAALISIQSLLLWKYSCFDKKFLDDWSSEIRRKKVSWQNWMAANFNVRKMYSNVERMDGCDCSIKIIIVLCASNQMLGRAIQGKLPECIFENIELPD